MEHGPWPFSKFSIILNRFNETKFKTFYKYFDSKGILKPNDLGRLRVEIYKYIAKPNIQIDNILKNIGHK